MGKTTLDQLPVIDITEGKKQPFARKVVVVAYHLKQLESGLWAPHFLFSVIVPKQSEKVTNNWQKAKHFKLPSGYSLIKGTKEMYMDGKEQDIPPAFSGYFRKLKSGNLAKKNINSKIDGLVPSVMSALKEAKEEAGVSLNNIEVIFDLGVRPIKINGRNLRVNSFAIELKSPSNGKAIDSLKINYFTLRELKLAAKVRTRYNIPLVRPVHYRFVVEVYELIKQRYAADGIHLSVKSKSKKKEIKHINKYKNQFSTLVKDARQGIFKAYKYSMKQTIKNIIKRSERSRQKRKQLLN